ncbi:MAG: hypothetical protein VX498_05400, partial [Myxococcota bacterium]|nr:hypothetical protein [Myxococcota bacterium]
MKLLKGIIKTLGVVLLLLVLALAIGWSTVRGRVQLADVYWNLVLDAGLVRADSYIGPHFWAVAVSPDGKRLAAGGMTPDVLIYDIETGEPLPSPFRHKEWVMEVLWSPKGTWFASTSFSGEVVIQKDATGEIVYRSAGRDVAYTVAFHPTEPLAAWGAYDGSVRLVDLSTGKEFKRISTNYGGVLYVTWTPDGTQIVTTGEDAAI